jgi:hypothetical protein
VAEQLRTTAFQTGYPMNITAPYVYGNNAQQTVYVKFCAIYQVTLHKYSNNRTGEMTIRVYFDSLGIFGSQTEE